VKGVAAGGLGQSSHLNAEAQIDEQRNDVGAAPTDEHANNGPAKTGLYGEGAAWGPRDFVNLFFLAPWALFTFVFSFMSPFLAMAQGEDSMVAWVPFAMSVSIGNLLLFFGIAWCCFCLIKGDKHYARVTVLVVFNSVVCGVEIVVRRKVPMLYAGASAILMAGLLLKHPGRRRKFALRTIGMFVAFELPLLSIRRFVPPLLCVADGITPLVTSFVYPMITTLYEGLYVPVIFYMWKSKWRRSDTPELALHFQLTIIMASSEALFYGGLVQMIHRYPEAMLPRYTGVSIISRCFGRLLDRSGATHWAASCCFSNQMDANRDLIGRHSNAQYMYGLLIVIMMAASGLMMHVVEVILGEQFHTVYTQPVFWYVMVGSVAMGFGTELCIAALSWWHRREMPDRSTYAQTFLTMHTPGRQPYFSTLRSLFGRPSDRSFENGIREREITDTVHPILNLLSPEKMVLLTAVCLSFAIGPLAQSNGFISDPDSANCD